MEESSREGAPSGGIRRRRRWRRWSFACLLALAVPEAVLRIWYREQLKIQTLPLIYAPDPVLGYKYVPGVCSRISIPGIDKEVRINENGYYGPGFALQKKPGVFRIAIVGSSNACGIWMEGEHTFAVELQRLFEEAGLAVEVLNCGVDGSLRSLANLYLVKNDVLRYGPDLVLLEADLPIWLGVAFREDYRGYEIDPGNSTMTREQIEALRQRVTKHIDEVEGKFVTRLFDASYCVRALQHALYDLPRVNQFLDLQETVVGLERHRTKRVKFVHVLESLDVPASIDCLRQTRDFVTAAGGKLILFCYGDGTGVEDELARIGISCLPLGLENDPALKQRFDEGHFNALGHVRLGEALFRALRDRGYPHS